MAFYQFRKTQLIDADLNSVWNFISNPQNLKVITPDYMGFDITSKNLGNEMYAGMIISYIVKPVLGIPTQWVTEITQIKDKSFFIDEQRIGPYAMWHHQHHIEEQEGGVLMTDLISYQPPLGVLGAVANSLFIRNKLNEIFDYRFKAVEKYFADKQAG
ncbi:SRPBCC family protein [Aureibacter tunicatorum]|uniref:Ligand-binding SRPBCC domain-containing protein n=1 Tax=Aureibacter tunicatorum TaxID=866807 RepID=A0AAE4BQD2_9BACT|nr:SRPBCC family protein [Aureibacter tunicatorum]MDR6237416.1 ligand-binding SRPBCC domain-containing protein [Aureibacter tunicatorum]BDD06406.1 hypothetical protein AUTU_38890 [Aureibacter tunicatorum]